LLVLSKSQLHHPQGIIYIKITPEIYLIVAKTPFFAACFAK